MQSRTHRHRIVLVLLITLGVMIAACGDDPSPTQPDPQPPRGTVEGTVILVPDDSLMIGVELVLLDVAKMEVAAGPVSTDELGFFRLSDVPEGRFYPIPLMDQNLQLDRSTDAVVVTEGDTARVDLRVIRSELWDAEGLKLTGIVRDAGSGAPIVGALVSMRLGDPAIYFEGITLPTDAVTDGEGRFELRGVPENFSRDLTWPIMITRSGYLPRSLLLALPAPGEPDSLHTAVELVRGQGDSAILGRVVLEGEPVAGVPVMLDWYQSGELTKSPDKAPLLGFSSTTDAGGWYRFEHLPPASIYTVAPGYLPDDGFFFYIHNHPHAQFPLVAGERDTIADLELGTLIQPIHPLPGAVVGEALPTFRWSTVAEADSYKISFTVGHLFGDLISLDEPMYQLDHPLPDGLSLRWYVYAFRDEEVIGGFDQIVTFDVDLSPAD